jgi:hypothetical protein
MRNYVIEFARGLRKVDGLLRVLQLPPLIKLTTTICTNVIEILLNETFITIPPPPHKHKTILNKVHLLLYEGFVSDGLYAMTFCTITLYFRYIAICLFA